MNLQDRELELNFRQITCKRAVNGDNFSRGIQDFDFSVSGKNAFIPALSYFVIEADLRVLPANQPRVVENTNNNAQTLSGGILRRPAVSDAIGFADHFGDTLYNNCYFRAGNSDVSMIQQFIPQAGVLKSRLDKSFAWSKSIGRVVFQDDADFERRRNYVSIDGKFHDDGLKPLQYTARPLLTGAGILATTFNNSQVGFDATDINTFGFGVLTIGVTAAARGTAVNPIASLLSIGDIVVLSLDGAPNSRRYQIISPPPSAQPTLADPNRYQYNAKPVGATARDTVPTAATTIISAILAGHDPACGSNVSQIMFQPPIGIFSESNPISGGDFKISLNPSPNFATNCIQSLTPLRARQSEQSSVDSYDYVLNIVNVFFYIATIKSDVSPTGVIPLSLVEMAVLNKQMNNSVQSQNLDFTVPPSTLAITVFVQAGNCGNTTTLPATRYLLQQLDPVTDLPAIDLNTGLEQCIALPNIANDLQSIQVTYGSVTKTQTLYSSAYQNPNTITGNGINNNVQRFLQSIQYSGKITSEGGSESHPQYLERGNYWHFDFSKDRNDTSSYVNVQIAFNQAVPRNTNLFIVAHYSRQAEISYENGFITQVVSVNR